MSKETQSYATKPDLSDFPEYIYTSFKENFKREALSRAEIFERLALVYTNSLSVRSYIRENTEDSYIEDAKNKLLWKRK